jgi:2-iminobutanoate/2-iminopropanoate deaminase
MAGKKVFFTQRAPEPKGPYSQAVIHDGLLYISGQVPVDPASGELVRGTIEEETEAVLNNIKIITEEAGADMDCVLKVTCYLADIHDFPRFNQMYEKYFAQYPPARSTLQAGKLPLDVQVEMDAIVALPGRKPRFSRSQSSRPRGKERLNNKK